MVQLYQAEWCPHSQHVRQRLTELGVDFIARQVPADKDARDDLEQVTGAREIPALVLAGGSTISGSQEIVEHLDDSYPETAQTAAHQEQASKHS